MFLANFEGKLRFPNAQIFNKLARKCGESNLPVIGEGKN